MSPGPGRLVEVETLTELDALLASGSRSMRGWRLQDLDLTGRSEQLRSLVPAGALLLGCDLLPADEEWLRAHGALVFPDVPDVPVNAYRGTLYTAEELYDGLDRGYDATLDARIYAWSRGPARADVAATLAQSLHDHAVDDALRELLEGRTGVVGVMGGHAMARGTPEYGEAAYLGQVLAHAGLLVSTGGGPGAMEAANLGARAARLDRPALDEALGRLAAAPSFAPSVEEWAAPAFEVLAGLGEPALPSLGIPTWFYGHEPPNPFPTHIAKYFRNALREDTLLHVCGGGIVFLPGAAGTVQELFQDACENYYAEPGSRTPMVLVGGEYWTRTYPAWPLLTALARSKEFTGELHLVDSWQEAVRVLVP
ncbi:MAG TPA: Rossmann fold nucleotide-binding protein [Marmoricola sp.]|nr:Rossmann fold nucleotide-binding protein [Marmoricola sp.]